MNFDMFTGGNEECFDFANMMGTDSTSKFNVQSSFMMEGNMFEENKPMDFMMSTVQSQDNFRSDADVMNFDFSFFPGQAENDNTFSISAIQTQNNMNYHDFGVQSKQSKCSNMDFPKSIVANFDNMFDEISKDQYDSDVIMKESEQISYHQPNLNISMSGINNLYDYTQKSESNNTQELNAFGAQLKEMEQMLLKKSKAAEEKNNKVKTQEFHNLNIKNVKGPTITADHKPSVNNQELVGAAIEKIPEEIAKKPASTVNHNRQEFINKPKVKTSDDMKANQENANMRNPKNEATSENHLKKANSSYSENLSIKIPNKLVNQKVNQPALQNIKQQEAPSITATQKPNKKAKAHSNIKTKLECVEEAEEPYEEINESNKPRLIDFSNQTTEEIYIENEKAQQFYDNTLSTIVEKKEFLKSLTKTFSSNLSILKKIEEQDAKINERLLETLERTCFFQKLYFNIVSESIKDRETTSLAINSLGKRAEAFYNM